MGLFHLANCLVLATGPYFLVYRATGMKENDAFWRCCKIMIFYGLTQMLKFFLATLTPHDYDFNSQNNFLFFELPGAVIELLVIFFIIRRLSARNEFGVLVASMGWSLAALFATSYIPIWVGAKGIEFDWRYPVFELPSEFRDDNNFLIVSHILVAVTKEGSRHRRRCWFAQYSGAVVASKQSSGKFTVIVRIHLVNVSQRRDYHRLMSDC
ncbi:hypothetical protein AHF37_02427 [Paragonimus kellicotti]|nr:hypothetical protein AHF37_02427 [Paragonimus kellicotti]